MLILALLRRLLIDWLCARRRPNPSRPWSMGGKSGTGQVETLGWQPPRRPRVGPGTAAVADAAARRHRTPPRRSQHSWTLDAGHIDSDTAGRQLLARHDITAPAGHPLALISLGRERHRRRPGPGAQNRLPMNVWMTAWATSSAIAQLRWADPCGAHPSLSLRLVIVESVHHDLK